MPAVEREDNPDEKTEGTLKVLKRNMNRVLKSKLERSLAEAFGHLVRYSVRHEALLQQRTVPELAFESKQIHFLV